ncbi:MAG: class I SAM-dependent methyltransferase [Candidatus Calescibacterium sp.]
MNAHIKRESSSFRDPDGFIFSYNGKLYRCINFSYQQNYEHLIQSGLYDKLVENELLIPHKEVQIPDIETTINYYKILEPEVIPFISYPYEWSFSQLKDAALVTLQIQKMALEYGMCLKDASAYNIQFRHGKPILIDILSFEKYQEGKPWVAYKQFCEHFLAPLALMAYKDIRLNQLLKIYIDGIPLNLATKLLPLRSWLRFPLLLHIHLHARSQKYLLNKNINVDKRTFSKKSLLSLIDSLESAISKLKWEPEKTEWSEYYKDTNYSQEAMFHKKKLVDDYIEEVKPNIVWDLGANIGIFSRIASNKGIYTVSFDSDPSVVEKSYLQVKNYKERNILPLCVDLTNPSPSIGWSNKERLSLIERGPCDLALMLGLIHHIAISNNVPLIQIADFLSQICRYLIIEFVPKDDSQVQRLLRFRKDIFQDYDEKNFEIAFLNYFSILKREKIVDSKRTIYLMKNKNVM